MSHFSPAAVLLWSILSALLLVFLVWHLWKFDRFACLGLGPLPNTSRAGGFKRLMTYSYICSVPLLLFYSVTFVSIKYYEGYFVVSPPETPPGSQDVVPLPFALWDDSSKRWILALYIAFSIAWALEIVSHLEELNFWLFLMSPTAPRSWFRSLYFVTWAIGSIAALAGLPVTAIVTRHDTIKSEAWIFFVGSSGSFIITVVSLKVLWLFPRFIELLRKQGADPHTIVRLSTYSQLNNVRVLFRFLFVVPLLTLAVDGIRPGHHHEVNESGFATDFLAMISGIGCVVQSTLTLLVFFPRSISQENGFVLLAQRSISAASQLQAGNEDERLGNPNDVPPSPYPMAQIGVGSVRSTPEESNKHRGVTHEWLAKQEAQRRQGSGQIRATGFGARARARSLEPGSTPGVVSVRNALRPVSRHSDHSGPEFKDGDLDESPGKDRDLKRDTIPSSYIFPTKEGDNDVLSSSLPTSSLGPLSFAAPGATASQKMKSFSTPSLSTVVELAISRTTSLDVSHNATPLSAPTHSQPAATRGEKGPHSGEIPQQAPQTRTPTSANEPRAPGWPFEWDYVDLENASGPGGATVGRKGMRRGSSASKAALIPGNPTVGGGVGFDLSRDELANVPFDEMRARGTRYCELAARRPTEAAEIHPYLKNFKSPLDLYDSAGR